MVPSATHCCKGLMLTLLLLLFRRRTRQSGPLGELFDHGVDAVNTSLEVLLFAGSQNMGQGWTTVAILFCCRSLLAKRSRSFLPNQIVEGHGIEFWLT